MLYFDRAVNTYRDLKVADLVTVLRAGDLLVFNVSRVRAARLPGTRTVRGQEQDTEVLVLKPLSRDGRFECLIRGKNIKTGERIAIKQSRAHLDVMEHLSGETGLFTVHVLGMNSNEFLTECEQIGQLPLPPYINNPQLLGHEQELYQPIMARELGSVASPTAALHFSNELLHELTMRGVKGAEVVLHVGLGTFLPVRVQDTKDHLMHAETVEVREDVMKAIRRTKEQGGRVIAVGTTVARALESAALSSVENSRTPHLDTGFFGETDLFIQPGFEFKIIDGLLTNFHMPKSTLLMMVSAFVGHEKLFELYHHALENNYRFLSFGDCMLLV